MNITPLLHCIRDLRHPDTGCHWDRKQTAADIAECLSREAAELAEAIAENDPDAIAGELGDVLWNVLFLTELAGEEYDLPGDAVVARSVGKMTRRHPHVFGDETAANETEARALYQAAKDAERNLDEE